MSHTNSRKVEGPSLEVHVIRYGKAWWMDLCAPTLDSWCDRNGHKLRVWGLEDISPDYPSTKFCAVDMLKEFLEGDSDWMALVDSDVYVDADAPRDPDLSGKSGFLIRSEVRPVLTREWIPWCSEKFGYEPRKGGIAEKWSYSNAGVWFCDRETARILLGVIRQPYYECHMEQHQWNWWLCLAKEAGANILPLPLMWNQWWQDPARKGAFYHFRGPQKGMMLKYWRRHGMIPTEPTATWIFEKSFDDSAHQEFEQKMEIDNLHRHLLHRAVLLDTGKPPLEKVAVEIGSYKGNSTVALLNALDHGKLGHLHLIEPTVRPELIKLITESRFPDRVTIHTKLSWETEISGADLVFIDGDHGWPAISDTLWALSIGADVIAMHDTNAKNHGYKNCWGAKIAGDSLRRMPGRVVFEDKEGRAGTGTLRGFMVSAVEGVDLAPLAEIVSSMRLSGSQPID